MRKLTPKQKENAKQVIAELIKDSNDRALAREQFLEGMREFLENLTGQQKVWLWLELEKQRCGGFLNG